MGALLGSVVALGAYAGMVNSRSDLLEESDQNSIKEKVHNYLDSIKSKTKQLSAKTKALMASVFSLSFMTLISSTSAFTGKPVFAITISTAIPINGALTAGVYGGYRLVKWLKSRNHPSTINL